MTFGAGNAPQLWGFAPCQNEQNCSELLPRPMGFKTLFVRGNAISLRNEAQRVAGHQVDYGGLHRMTGSAETGSMVCSLLHAIRGGSLPGNACSHNRSGI
jgi:hypothetical protein